MITSSVGAVVVSVPPETEQVEGLVVTAVNSSLPQLWLVPKPVPSTVHETPQHSVHRRSRRDRRVA